jgi:hypothetical protein
LAGNWGSARAGLAALGIIAASVPCAAQSGAIEFGDDNSEFAKDGECDDLRFSGEGRAALVLTDTIGHDASDCRAAFEAETVSLDQLFVRPETSAAIIYGDDASDYAKDGECDDVRFAHAGSAAVVYLEEDIAHDATDCKAGIANGSLTWQGHLANPVRGISAEQLLAEQGD